jgi:hypothetical protein
MSDAQTKPMEMMNNNLNKGNEIKPLTVNGKSLARQLEDKL